MTAALLGLAIAAALGLHPLVPQLFVTRTPPANIQAYAARADAIVVVEVAGPCYAIDNHQRNCPFRLVDVVKDDGHLPKPGGALKIHRHGTEMNPESGFEKPFLYAERYLLALTWVSLMTVHTVAYGPDGAVQIKNGKLNPLGRSPLSVGWSQRELQAVITEMRSAAK
jgi:hypothetical protein